MKFGEKVRDLRKKHSLTQDELAKCLGVSKRTVIGWERDGRYPRNVEMHYPVFCYNGQFRRGADGTPLTYMLHGHIHKSEDQVLVDRFSTETRAMMRKSAHQETAQPVPCQMINCFCMYSDYTPLTLEEWVECDQRRRDKADR